MAQANATMIEPTDDAQAIYLMNHPDSVEEIPVIDIGAYLAGKPGADHEVADALREATETVGFFYLKNHGVPQSLIDRMFAESKRFFALPVEDKRKIPRVDNFGYMEMKEERKHKSNEYLIKTVKPALNESFIVGRERSADDPELNKMFRRLNSWPENLPGFRETLLEYHGSIEALGRKFLRLWAKSLDLPDDFFEPYFKVPHVNLRLAHYPPQDEIDTGQYGINPHTDNCLMTFLAQANVPGLAVQMPSGHWRRVEIIPGTLLINTGNLMLRWTNGRYKSTKHVVINSAGVDRYSCPVFFGPSFDALIECLPTCCGPDRPARFDPITYEDLRKWYYGFHN
jgi:isopenicillin N synthase-like dioxygenase